MWFPWNCCQMNGDVQQLKNNRTDRVLKVLMKIFSPIRWIWKDKENMFDFLLSDSYDALISNIRISTLQIRHQECLIFHGQSHCQWKLWTYIFLFLRILQANPEEFVLTSGLAVKCKLQEKNSVVQWCHFRVLQKGQKKHTSKDKSPMHGAESQQITPFVAETLLKTILLLQKSSVSGWQNLWTDLPVQREAKTLWKLNQSKEVLRSTSREHSWDFSIL